MGKCNSCGSGGNGGVETLPINSSTSTSQLCGSCGCTVSSGESCGCGSNSPCQEDHTHNNYYQRYSFTLKTTGSFVWPETGESVTFFTQNVDRLGVGSLLYKQGYGYLHVVSFSCLLQQVVAENEGEQCNTYTGGETIPDCTEFIVGPPTCLEGSELPPGTTFLTADFISPGEGDCGLASVNLVGDIAPQDIVSINGYLYTVGGVIDANTLSLCNDGDGAPEGTVIEWDPNGDGVPDVPVYIAQSNICSRDGVFEGLVVVCDDGVQKPIIGNGDDQYLKWNNLTEKWEVVVIDPVGIVDEDEATSADPPILFDTIADELDVGPVTFNITNTSTTKTMKLMFTHVLNLKAAVFSGSGRIRMELSENVNGAGSTVVLSSFVLLYLKEY